MRRYLIFPIIFLAVAMVPIKIIQAEGENRWEAKRERVRSLILLRVSNELELTDSQTKQLGAILDKYHQQRREAWQQIQKLTPQLRSALNSNNDHEIKKLIQEIQNKKNQKDQLDHAMFSEVQKMLTLHQQAKYILVMEEIRKQIWEMKRR
jgi:hypothetical protein